MESVVVKFEPNPPVVTLRSRPEGETAAERVAAKLPPQAIYSLGEAQSCPRCSVRHNHPVVIDGRGQSFAVCDSITCRTTWSVALATYRPERDGR